MTIKFLDSKRISTSPSSATSVQGYSQLNAGTNGWNIASGAGDGERLSLQIVSGSSIIADPIKEIKMKLYKNSSPTDTLYVRVRNSSDTILAEASKVASTLTGSLTEYTFTLNTGVILAQGDRINIEYTGPSGSGNIGCGVNNATEPSTVNCQKYDGTSYSDIDRTPDWQFDSSPSTTISILQSHPVNVQDNSILVEKDTANRFWFDAEISNLALTDPTPASSDYTNSGSSFTFASNKIHVDAVGYGSTLTMCTRPLTSSFVPTTDGCIIDFKFNWTTAGGSGNDTGVAIGLWDARSFTDNTNNGICIEFVTSPSYSRNVQYRCEGVFDNSSVQGYPVPDEYYCRIIVQKDGSSTGKGYTSESDRTADTNAVFSRSTAAQTGFSSKTLFGILNVRPTGGANVIGDLDNMKVYTGLVATDTAWSEEGT